MYYSLRMNKKFDIIVAGEIIVYNRQSKDLPFIRVIRRIK